MGKENKVAVFMKGSPGAPRCGFSGLVDRIMEVHDVNSAHMNVLEDEDVRSGIKTYSDWPTIPQVYIDGEFVGGSDLVLQMHQQGELEEAFRKIGVGSPLPPPEPAA